MITIDIMKIWVLEALKSLGGKGWPVEVSKYIWEHYEKELKNQEICSTLGNMIFAGLHNP